MIREFLVAKVSSFKKKYLGLQPIMLKNKPHTFRAIIDHVGNRIRQWKGKLFSQAGKLKILIKAMTLVDPTY